MAFSSSILSQLNPPILFSFQIWLIDSTLYVFSEVYFVFMLNYMFYLQTSINIHTDSIKEVFPAC